MLAVLLIIAEAKGSALLGAKVGGDCQSCYSSYCSAARKQGQSVCHTCVLQHKSDLAKGKCQNYHGNCEKKAMDWCKSAPKPTPKPLPKPSPAPPTPTPATCSQDPGFDYAGNTLGSMSARSFQQCCNHCTVQPACAFFTFWKDDANDVHNCLFKSSKAGRVANSSRVSGQSPPAPPLSRILPFISADPLLQNLSAACKLSGACSTYLNSTSDLFTVFAPNDAAFSKLPASVRKILDDPMVGPRPRSPRWWNPLSCTR